MFRKYPDIGTKIKSEAFRRYRILIKEPMIRQKQIDLEGEGDNEFEDSVSNSDNKNKKNNNGGIKADDFAQEEDGRKDNTMGNSADLHTTLKKKIDGIQDEMSKFAKNINDYVRSCDNEISSIVSGLKKDK